MRDRSHQTIALIDIGTNSAKLLIATVAASSEFRERHFSRIVTRLGANLERSGRIERAALDRTIATLLHFRSEIERRTCDKICAFSTHVLRQAANSGRALRAIRRETGFPVRVLTGSEEAQFAFLSAKWRLRIDKPHVVHVDIGGGSAEFLYARGARVIRAHSLPLGALQLTERFLKSDPIEPREYRAMDLFIRRHVKRSCRPLRLQGITPRQLDLIASGGAVSTLARMIASSEGPAGGRPVPDRIRLGDLQAFSRRCLVLSLEERKRIPGLEPDRADIIVAGLAVIVSLLRETGKRVLRMNKGGVREGVLYHLIENELRWSFEKSSTESA